MFDFSNGFCFFLVIRPISCYHAFTLEYSFNFDKLWTADVVLTCAGIDDTVTYVGWNSWLPSIDDTVTGQLRQENHGKYTIEMRAFWSFTCALFTSLCPNSDILSSLFQTVFFLTVYIIYGSRTGVVLISTSKSMGQLILICGYLSYQLIPCIW